ncbi:aminotransferase class V-fold PLP-dependent enzyme [Ruminococcus sp. AF14-10]|nr:aminotransferase class V-fold PLP-dependent enzyme [Ruminococcus sp. AF14-10]
MLYMDNAATTLRKPPEVIRAVTHALESMGNAGRGLGEAAFDAARIIYDTRERLCRLFNGENPRQIAFTKNSTESLNLAIRGLIRPGDHVVTTVLEHNSVLRPLYERQENGAELTIVGCDESGVLDYDVLEQAVRPDTRAVICTHGSNLTGNLVDLQRVSEAAKRQGALLIVDASQTAGVFPIDVQKQQIDVLCFTGHKSLLGPQGTGGLYVKPGLQIEPLTRGGSGIETYNPHHPEEMPVALEAGTLNGHGIAGLNGALCYLEKTGIDKIRRKEQDLMWQFYEGIKGISGIRIYGDFLVDDHTTKGSGESFFRKERCPIVTFNLGDYDSGEVSDALLTDYGIATRSGGHCAPLMHEALGTRKQGAVRFSFSHYNTEEEVEIAINAIHELA